MTITDVRGLQLSAGSADGAAAFDRALDLFLDYEIEAGAAAKAAPTDHPDLVMAAVLRGAMMLMVETVGTQPKVAALAESRLAASERLTERERLHLRALARWASGDPRRAALAWDRILADHPLDLLALKLHHYTTFWTGRAEVMRSTVEGVLDAWDETTPGYDHVLGMQAFALGECGRYEEAGRIGREAMERNPEDLWSVHAVAHSLEMVGDHAAGTALFDDLVAAEPELWATKNPFRGHLWWHAALFPYSAGDHDRVLALYDQRIEPASTDFYLDLQNRTSLLARLELAGVDVGDRWDELGDQAAARIADHVLTFTDVHCCLALARTGRLEDLDRFVASLVGHRASRTTREPPVQCADLDVAIPLAEGLRHRAAGHHAEAAESLVPLRGDLAPIGGSHAQRDLFHQLTIDVVRRAGDDRLAEYLLAARTHRWPNHEPTWRRYAEVLAANGHDVRAAAARQRADSIRGGAPAREE